MMGIDHFKPLILTVLVLVLLFAVSRLLLSRKSMMSKFSQSDITVKSSVSLGGKSKLAVIEVDGQRILLGVTESSITKISDLKPEDNTVITEVIQQEQLDL